MKVGIGVFQLPGWYPQGIVDSLILEYKEFVEANSSIKLNLAVTYNGQLQDGEFLYDGVGCYFPSPSILLPSTKGQFPIDTDCNILLYDWRNKSPCYGGGTWYIGFNNVPLVAIPLGAWNDELYVWGPWIHSKTQAIVHEWLHALDSIFERVGYVGFRSSDDCDQPPYNYDGTTDPGWVICYKRMLSEITPDMYAAIHESTGTLTTCTSNQINITGRCVNRANIIAVSLGTAILGSIIVSSK